MVPTLVTCPTGEHHAFSLVGARGANSQPLSGLVLAVRNYRSEYRIIPAAVAIAYQKLPCRQLLVIGFGKLGVFNSKLVPRITIGLAQRIRGILDNGYLHARL